MSEEDQEDKPHSPLLWQSAFPAIFCRQVGPRRESCPNCVGLLGYYVLNLILIPLFKNYLGPGAFAVAASFLQMFYKFSLFEKWQKHRRESTNIIFGEICEIKK